MFREIAKYSAKLLHRIFKIIHGKVKRVRRETVERERVNRGGDREREGTERERVNRERE